MFSDIFVSGSTKYNTFSSPVNAPYIRKTFNAKGGAAKINATCTGFYRVFLNGKEYTKGIMAPYPTNPNQIMYYDTYDVELIDGKNCVAFILGNGLSNSLDSNVWGFEKASFRSAPKLAFSVESEEGIIEADGAKTHPSPILFDDYHAGEWFDKNLEIKDFACPDYDDKDWTDAISVTSPKGEKMASLSPAIITEKEILAKSIKKVGDGYVYDFGIVSAGNMKLTLRNSEKGQSLTYVHTEITKKGVPFLDTLVCGPMKHNQTFKYTAAGEAVEVYEPWFSYVGCRYVYVTGIRDDQATEDLFTFKLMHGDFEEVGFFECSDDVANRIEATIKNSDKSNLYYFPTDCPQREKNGWTGDAAISAEHMLANFDVTNNFKAWMRLVSRSQKKDGKMPGIVPTDGWGFLWGNGPAWDAVLFWIPYQAYRVSGDREILDENADAMFNFLKYVESKKNASGLISYGLGDWLQPYGTASGYDCPDSVSGTLVILDVAKKAASIFALLGQNTRAEYARNFADSLRRLFKKKCVDPRTMRVEGNTQTGQAMAIYLDIFTEFEMPKAKQALLDFIKRDNDALNAGFVGARFLFHSLAKIGETELAYRLITQDKYPSYGYMVNNGATSSWEAFEKVVVKPNGDLVGLRPYLKPTAATSFRKATQFATLAVMNKINPKSLECRVASLNHHAFGDVSNFFKREVAGLYVNDGFTDVDHVDVKPFFVSTLSYAQASRRLKAGVVSSRWERNGDEVLLKITAPDKVFGKIVAPAGYCFKDGAADKQLSSGEYVLKKIS